MKIFVTKSHIAQENLALEETILKDEEIKEDVIMFYINKNCIVIGRNQNVWEEINDDYVQQEKINLARRISGGGAVYQDVDNICFSFITSASKSYLEFLKPVLEFLKTLGLDAQFHGKNDIHVSGYKVSGNAQFKYKNRMVHHGTILFNTNLTKLASALKPNLLKMESKGIKSHRQRVKNLYELLDNKISTKNFVVEMVEFFKLKYNAILFDESSYKLETVARLTNMRSSKDWVYGKNPEFEIANHKRFAGGTIKLLLNTSKNKIKDINFTGDFLSKVNLQEIFGHFIGKEYEKDVIKKTLDAIANLSDFFGLITKEEILSLFFDN